MQFDAKKESSSSDPKLKDEEHLHTLWSCNYLQPDFQNPNQGLVRGSTSRTRVFALLQVAGEQRPGTALRHVPRFTRHEEVFSSQQRHLMRRCRSILWKSGLRSKSARGTVRSIFPALQQNTMHPATRVQPAAHKSLCLGAGPFTRSSIGSTRLRRSKAPQGCRGRGMNEIFPLRCRAEAQCLIASLCEIFSASVALGFPVLQQSLGAPLAFTPSIAVLAAGFAYVSRKLPETKNREVEDILADFNQR
ncbi:unnamed protein product [Cladocopium goreaui]|uniref:Solute carrier family 2, facilitated glucose transporter member 3 n=1 Tax=Cladocopium goreaui TaxID=2562237 RepID=A0A9P1BMN5_9DINO|nr:unnamed protein product [Cladocopium goreaui]